MMLWPSVFPPKKQSQIHYFQNVLVTEYLWQVDQTHFLHRNYFNVFEVGYFQID